MSITDQISEEVSTNGLSRRRFIQGAAAAGVSIPLSQMMNDSGVSAATSTTLRVATGKQEHVAAPWETSGGSLFILAMVGEWLCWQRPDGSLEPRAAESWTSSADAKQWVFKIRAGVKFNDGTPLTADDVVYTYTSIFDKTITKGISRSKGNYDNILEPTGVVKVDASTVQFNLLQPVANFPYFVSSASYGMCIIKKGAFGGAGWEKTMVGAGPWKMVSHVNTESTVYEKNPYYWDKNFNPGFDKVEFIQFLSAAAALPLLKTGKLDYIAAIEASDALALDKSKFNIATTKMGAGGLHAHMRTNFGPFQDKRVREAAALSVDRVGYIAGVLKGLGGVIANDSVMDAYPSADKSVPQRKQDLARAKALMKEAGVPNGFSVDLSTWARDDINKYAKLIKSSLAKIGIKVNLVIDGSDGGSAVYYTYDPYPSKPGKVNQFDNHSWLASNLGITEWSGRGVPDTYLMREFRSTGDWSGAMLDSRVMDAAVDSYLQALSPAAKKKASKAIQTACLAETPYLIVNTAINVTASRKTVTGLAINGMLQIDCSKIKNV
jgi:peptide/nickel transport system substrate-binding protein